MKGKGQLACKFILVSIDGHVCLRPKKMPARSDPGERDMFLGYLCTKIWLSKSTLKWSVLNGCEVALSLRASASVDE